MGDFNGDGRLDIAAGFVKYNPTTDIITADGVSVLLGNGDGTFQSPVNYAAGDLRLDSLAVGDFNGDGRADLAYIEVVVTGSPSVLLNTNSDTLSNSTITSTPIRDNPLLADLSGDGTNDLTVIDQSGDILYRKGDSRTAGLV